MYRGLAQPTHCTPSLLSTRVQSTRESPIHATHDVAQPTLNATYKASRNWHHVTRDMLYVLALPVAFF